MSQLVDRAIDAAGLRPVLEARRAGAALGAHLPQLLEADLLALGALADRVRTEEVGATVRIYTGAGTPRIADATGTPRTGDASGSLLDDDARVVTIPRDDKEVTGLDLLREVAIARVTGPRAARVRVDWTRCGLELAQVALGFGADELAGFIATKRGLPIADGELSGVGKKSKRELAQVVKRKELAACVERGGRVPVFVRADGVVEAIDGAGPLQEAM